VIVEMICFEEKRMKTEYRNIPFTKTSNPNPFYLALLAVVIFTTIAGAASFWLSSQDKLNEHQLELLFLCNESWHGGLLAISTIAVSLAHELLASERKSK
jgi:hypothetical protein